MTKFKHTMLDKYTVLKTYWKNPETIGHAIHHYSMAKYIDDRYNIEKDDFLVITPYIIYTNIYRINNNWIERN